MILITTPTGQIGGQTLTALLDAGADVRVIVRDASKLDADVDAVEGSHGDPAVLDRALPGADAVLWIPPGDPRAQSVDDVYSGFTKPAAEAFARHGVARVVGVSALGRGTPVAGRAGNVTASLAMDDLIAGSGVAYRALTCASFMDNTLRQAGAIAGGSFFTPMPLDDKAPACATRDIAAAATRLLLDDTWDGHGEVPVLGPEDISPVQMAQTMTDVLGHPVAAQHVPIDAFRDQLHGAGMSEPMAQAMLDMMTAKTDGLDAGVERTEQTASPTSFRQWCEDVLVPAMPG